jgi:hypothetical protein
MKLWSTESAHFWAWAITSLGILTVVGGICHTQISPPRMYWQDSLIVIPLGLCGYVSVRARSKVDFWTRAAFGFGQSIMLISIYSDPRAIALGRDGPVAILCQWALVAVVYSGVFAAVTQGLTSAVVARATSKPGICLKCGYLLKGLTIPRCPECGEPFDPGSLSTDRL